MMTADRSTSSARRGNSRAVALTVAAASLLLLAVPATALQFDCAKVDVPGVKIFDLSPLKRDYHPDDVTRHTTPSTTIARWTFNPCQTLAWSAGTDQNEQCSKDAWVCMTMTVVKGTYSGVTQVWNPVIGDPKPEIGYSAASGGNDLGSNVTLKYTGDVYGKQFTTTEIFECAKEEAMPTVDNYSDTAVEIHLKTPVACKSAPAGTPPPAVGSPPPPTGGQPGQAPPPQPSGGGSAFGGFMLFLFVSFIGYMIVGTLYRRFVLHLSGTDQIPHYETFARVPEMAVDLFRYLKGCVCGRDRGYIQV